jgi:hypothetical protein
MIPFPTWREAFRIPWLRENRSGFRFLHEVFLLQLVLYRSGRLRDFLWAQKRFFEMAHSIAQYGRREASDTVSRLLEIPWFSERRRSLLGMIAAYNRIVTALGLDGAVGSEVRTRELERIRGDVEVFIRCLKGLLAFDAGDEARVRQLMRQPDAVARRIDSLLALAGCSSKPAQEW